jgi:hypothetical protein
MKNTSAPAIRLTPRGRMVMAAAAAITLIGAMSAIGNVQAGASDSRNPQVVVVQPGESLWTIAQDVAPQADPRATVVELKRLNGLTSSVVQVGQALVVS